jgi:hypothetical protein
MPDIVTKAVLTPARKRLVELMQEINFGRIENLQIRDAEPIFNPPPTVLRHYLFGKENGPNAYRIVDNFSLKKKLAELFAIFDHERSLSIQELIIDNGLPLRMTVADWVKA